MSYSQDYYLKNKDKIRKKQDEYNKRTNYEAIKNYMEKNQECRLFHAAKQNAKRTGIDFTITVDDIIIPERCPFLGFQLTNVYRAGRVQTNASLDRIDSTKGYIPGNVQVISDLANRMKQDATPQQLIRFAERVLMIYTEEA